jgi:hypothetical protein
MTVELVVVVYAALWVGWACGFLTAKLLVKKMR